MRRRDREITDPAAILAIVDECEVLRLGLADGDYPYIVPVNFAYRMEGGVLCFYIHGAMAGRKYMLLSENPVCSFEMDVPLGIECIPEKGDATMRYRSVMGKASVTFLNGEDRERALDEVIMARSETTRDFPYNRAAIGRTMVARLAVTEITAKANNPGGGAD